MDDESNVAKARLLDTRLRGVLDGPTDDPDDVLRHGLDELDTVLSKLPERTDGFDRVHLGQDRLRELDLGGFPFSAPGMAPEPPAVLDHVVNHGGRLTGRSLSA